MPVLAAAFCPHPPLLLPDLGGAAAQELAGLRQACDTVVAAIAACGVRVVVLGAGPAEATYDGTARGSFAPWGADIRAGHAAGARAGAQDAAGAPAPAGAPAHAGAPTQAQLPLSLTVGAWLLDRAGVPLEARTYLALPPTDLALPPTPLRDHARFALAADSAEPVVLLVMADGSAARTPKAPASFHPGAQAYDSAVAAALASGDPAALVAAAGQESAGAVAAGGVSAWRAAGAWLASQGTASAELVADDAPYGVGYFVALWTWPR